MIITEEDMTQEIGMDTLRNNLDVFIMPLHFVSKDMESEQSNALFQSLSIHHPVEDCIFIFWVLDCL